MQNWVFSYSAELVRQSDVSLIMMMIMKVIMVYGMIFWSKTTSSIVLCGMYSYIPTHLLSLTAAKVRAWLTNYTPQVYIDVITNPCPHNNAG